MFLATQLWISLHRWLFPEILLSLFACFSSWTDLSAGIFKPPALIACLHNVAVMGQPVKQRCGHLVVAKHIVAHSEKLSLVVITTQVRSYSLDSR